MWLHLSQLYALTFGVSHWTQWSFCNTIWHLAHILFLFLLDGNWWLSFTCFSRRAWSLVINLHRSQFKTECYSSTWFFRQSDSEVLKSHWIQDSIIFWAGILTVGFMWLNFMWSFKTPSDVAWKSHLLHGCNTTLGKGWTSGVGWDSDKWLSKSEHKVKAISQV